MSGGPSTPIGPWADPSEGLRLNTLLRSLRCIIMVWMALFEILLLSPEELEEMRRSLREESLRQRAEYDILSRYL